MDLEKKILIAFSGIYILTAGLFGCAGHRGESGRNGSRQEQPPSKKQLFNQYDKDQDGRLSKEEFPGPDDHFTQLDQNSDGYLDEDEVPEGPPSRK